MTPSMKNPSISSVRSGTGGARKLCQCTQPVHIRSSLGAVLFQGLPDASPIGPTIAGSFGLPGFISSYLSEVNIQILNHVTSNQGSLKLVSFCPLYRTVSVPVPAPYPAHLPVPVLHPDAVHHLVLYRRRSLRFPSHHYSHKGRVTSCRPTRDTKMCTGNHHGLRLLWLFVSINNCVCLCYLHKPT